MSTIITPSEDQINIVITDDSVNVNVTSEPVVVNVTDEIIQVSPISGAYPLPTTVYSVFGRTGSVVAQEGDYDLSKLSDVTLLNLANNDVLSYNGTNWVNEQMDLSGYVTLATNQIITGNKTFTEVNYFQNNTIFDLEAQFSIGHYLVKGGTPSGYAAGQVNVYSETSTNNVVFRDPSSKAKLVFNNSTQTYTFPAASGTIALTSDIPSLTGYVPYTGATTNVNLGIRYITTNGITSNAGISLSQSAGAIGVSGYTIINGFSSGIEVRQNTTNILKLYFPAANNNYTFPNASGTLALTSDLTNFVTLIGVQTLSNKTFSDVVNLGNNGFKIAGITGVNPVQMFMSNSVSTYLFNSNSFGININNDIFYSKDANNRSVLSFNNTSERIYSFPNASGTLALTSSLASYVPYTGATSTLNLGSQMLMTSGYIRGGNSLQVLYNPSSSTYDAGYNTIQGNATSFAVINPTTGFRFIFPSTASYFYTLPDATGTIALTSDIPSTSTFVPYTGATANVNLGSYSLTANALIKNGGVDTQFLKADGSVDNNVYLTTNDLPSTLSLYATTTASSISGYTKLVTTISDPDYNTTAVDVSTGTITTTNQFIAALVSPANLINGNPGIFNVSTYGNIKKVSGSGEAEFYFEIYKRTSAGVETLVGTSSNTLPVVNSGYSEFFATAIWNDGVFDVTDTIVLKYYATRITGGSDPVYNFQFGGTSPVRTLVPIPIAVIPNIYMADIADVENVAPLNNEVLHYNSTSTLWEHSTIAGLLGYTPANDASVAHIAGTETITGEKTFSNPIIGDFGMLLKNLSQPTPSTGYIGIGSNGAGITISIRNVSTVYNNQLLFPTTASNNYNFPNATGTIALTSDIPSLTGYVPYTGATANVDLGVYNLTAASLIKSGGTSAQILAADGSVITAGTNITISGGTISSTGGGGSMEIGGTITGATTGSVLFVNSGSTLAQDNTNFFWDDTNNRLGIGSKTLGSTLQINGNAAIGYSASTAAPTNGLAVAGQIGIGKTSTVQALDVVGNFFLRNISGAGGTGYGVEFATDSSSPRVNFVVNASYVGEFSCTTTDVQFKNTLGGGGGGIKFITFSNQTRATITSGGLFGINTTTIGSQFQVNGNAAIGYSASTAAPTNGLAVAGATTIGGDTTISGVLIQTITTNRQTASYSLVLSDRGKLVEMNVATANTLTVPLNSSIAYPIGTEINIAQYGAGQTTIVATSGVTIRSTNSWLKINARYGAATLVKIGTDEWYLFGNLNA